ncbi:uncharacterized protein LOC126970108 [Leptidea sinapis]|uniref:uncharacterized protein LOC126970108 n=1 Tax=Leptidea sinapis TaxID=189913 RepID=UPI002138BE77|nr:uncharacterized protein LOC126970108 [Leptidea sinapis]
MREFKYDVIQLIQSVRERPCLWDKTQDTYKDRFERRTAWQEVFATLDEGYNDMTLEDKRLMGEQVLYKWTNIRDTFMKSLKAKLGRPRRKYVFHKYLKFLIDKSDDNIESGEETYCKVEKETPKEKKRSKKTREIKKPKVFDCTESQDSGTDLLNINEIDEVSDPRLMNEDEAFFASLLPTIVKYNEDEKLEFRIEVLNVMRNIKEKKNWGKIEME